MKAPDAPGKLIWTIEAASKDGKQRDRLVFDQMIEPAVPIETWAASLLPVGADTGLPIAPHAGALAGGPADMRLSGAPAPPRAGGSPRTGQKEVGGGRRVDGKRDPGGYGAIKQK